MKFPVHYGLANHIYLLVCDIEKSYLVTVNYSLNLYLQIFIFAVTRRLRSYT